MAVQELKAHPEREESLLRPVVEVAFESAAFLVAGLEIRARDSRSSSSWARSCAWSRSFSRASRAAEPTDSNSRGWSSRSRSWISTASRSPTYVTARARSSDASISRPCSSAHRPRSGSHSPNTSDGSPNVRANASRTRPGSTSPNSTTRSDTDARA